MKKKLQRGRAKPAAKKKPSTALAVRKKELPVVRVAAMLKAAKKRAELTKAPESTALTDDISLGALGLVELKLTEAEEIVLSRPLNRDLVAIKPTGEPYLPHPHYTRLLNEAFGRLGWNLRPAAKPMLSEAQVVCPYVLSIHGLPAALAWGEQDYFTSNKKQSYGDALESTVASALRRVTKHIGIALELWDKEWLEEFRKDRCVHVWLDAGKEAWRLRSAEPFYNETGIVGQRRRQQPPQQEQGETREHQTRAVPSTGYTRGDGELLITDHVRDKNKPGDRVGQLQRLFAIAAEHKRDHKEIKDWLYKRYHYESSKHIKRKHYDEICKALEGVGPLPMGEREPGEDD